MVLSIVIFFFFIFNIRYRLTDTIYQQNMVVIMYFQTDDLFSTFITILNIL